MQIDPKFKFQQASELRDSIEVFQATDYQRFLSKLVPVFLKILGDGQPIFVSTIPEQVCLTPSGLIIETACVHSGDSASTASQ